MNSLDSRFLHVGDCYGRRFTRAGTIPYALSRLPLPSGSRIQRDTDLAVTVLDASEENPKISQHNVTVSERDGALRAAPANLEIALGDTVLWVPDKTVKIGFCVRGANGRAFDSASLTSNSLYTHAFGSPGRYIWRDAHGSKLGGEVHVTTPQDGEREDWLKALSKGTLIHVSDAEAKPATVKVVVGQTVFWAIAEAQGVSITDVTLLGQPPLDSP
jgi:plastocyanin